MAFANADESALRPEKRAFLLAFIREKAEADQSSASFAIIILVLGIDCWCKAMRSKQSLLSFVIRLRASKTFLPPAMHLFNAFVCTELNAFFDAVRSIVGETRDRNLVQSLFELVTGISIQHASLVGSRSAQMIAMLGFSDVAEGRLAVHSDTFRTVAKFDKTLLIDGSDGTVPIFQRNKFVLQKRLFLSPIAIVSIDPSGRIAAALSYETRELNRFDIPTNAHLKEPVVYATNMYGLSESIALRWERNEVVVRGVVA
jgi:hypothetical protein